MNDRITKNYLLIANPKLPQSGFVQHSIEPTPSSFIFCNIDNNPPLFKCLTLFFKNFFTDVSVIFPSLIPP
jgi:hypothetical protein